MLSWQYNGVAPWTEIVSWCYNTLNTHGWQTNSFETIYFYNEQDYTTFLLRWT